MGATGYLGSRIARNFATNGNQLLLSGRDFGKLLRLKSELIALAPTVEIDIEVLDLENRETWDASGKRFSTFNPSVFFNCAGIQGKINLISKLNISDYEQVMSINLFSSIYFTKVLINSSNSEFPLRIIHFSGGGAATSRPNFSPYSLSKTALVRFVENLASELTRERIYINAVAPGVLPSKMQQEVLAQPHLTNSKDSLVAYESLGNTNQTHTRLLNLCNFLASDISDGITGKFISAEWDAWENWPNHIKELQNSELYSLRRVTAREKGLSWGDA